MRWSPAHTGLLLIGVGALLMVNPVYYQGLDVWQESYRYETTPVSFDESSGRLQVGDPSHVRGVDPDILCLASRSRACELERHLIEAHPVPSDLSPAYADRYPDYRYVYHDGAFYEINTSDRNGTTHLTLTAVPPTEAFERASTPLHAAPAPARTAVRSGAVTVSDPLEIDGREVRGGLLLGDGDRFHHLHRVGHHDGWDEAPWLTAGTQAVGSLVGLALVLRGQRARVLEPLRR